MTKLSVGVVTFNSANVLTDLLNSLAAEAAAGTQLTVYVADNQSRDDSVEVAKRHRLEPTVDVMPTNMGYGRGHNEIIKAIESEYHLVVNPDVRFEPGVLRGLVEFLDASPSIGLVTPRILNRDGSEQFLPKRDPRLRYFLGGLFESWGGLFRKWRQEYTRQHEDFRLPVEIQFCTGCFMLFRTEALKELGGFDDRFFLYLEDADIARRVRHNGRVVFNPNFEVTHRWSRDNVRKFRGRLLALRSMVIYMQKWGWTL